MFISVCSNAGFINAGNPQGTLSGPLNFKLLINDLIFDQDYIKYVGDTVKDLSILTVTMGYSIQCSTMHITIYSKG